MNKEKIIPIQLPSILNTIRDLKDKSGKISFVTRELSNKEFCKLRDIIGMEGWLCFAQNELQPEDIPDERADIETKSQSKRLRSVLFLEWKQQKEVGQTEEEFEKFYNIKMEKAIQSVKNKLD